MATNLSTFFREVHLVGSPWQIRIRLKKTTTKSEMNVNSFRECVNLF